MANPHNGTVVHGSATIEHQSNTTTITQTTNKGVINWEGFSISENEITQFKQPSSSSVTLNRVTGSDPSALMGKLTANGQVILVNPNGIVFGPNAIVDVGGLIASTANITNEDFMNDRYIFKDAPIGSSIENYGDITVQDAGLVALVAPTVENHGVIRAEMGTVIIGGAESFTIDPYGDGLITFDAGALIDEANIQNKGEIRANGGTVMITAQATKDLMESLINVDGYVEATTVVERDGRIVLMGDQNTQIMIAGEINASGSDAGEVGGIVQVTAETIHMADTSIINVSGDAGGGTVHIGSDQYHNPGDDPTLNTFGTPAQLATATYTFAAQGAQIFADAINTGDGGDVVVWADKYTWYYGEISAKGGVLSGDGGRVETSGYEYLDVEGARVNTLAANGLTGEWLLDPRNVTITDATTSNGSFDGLSPNTFTPSGDDSEVSVATINTNLETASVIITTGGTGVQDGNVTFSNTDPLSWTNGNDFTVTAANNVIFSASLSVIASPIGDFIINAGNDISFTATTAITLSGTGNAFFNADNNIILNSGAAGTVLSTASTGYLNLKADADNDGTGLFTLTQGVISAQKNAANLFYSDAIGNATLDFSSFTSTSGSGEINIYKKVFYAGGASFTNADGTNVATGLDPNGNGSTPGTNYILTWSGDAVIDGDVSVPWATANTLTFVADGDITLSDPGAASNQFSLTGAGTLNFRADADASGAGALVVASTANSDINVDHANASVNVYYKATTLGEATPSDYTDIMTGSTGAAALTAWQLIYDTVVNHTLSDIAGASLSSSYALAENVSSNLGAFTSIGTSGTPFTGEFTGLDTTKLDGTAYTISSLTINQAATDNVGLFGYVDGGTIQYITLSNSSITGRDNVGGIAGTLTGSNIDIGTLTVDTVTVDGEEVVGGVIGTIINSTIDGSLINIASDVTSTVTRVGGVVAAINNSTLTDGFANSGTVTGVNSVGGLISDLVSATLSNAVFVISGTVTASGTNIGGVLAVFDNAASSLPSNIDTGATVIGTGSASNVGGVIGLASQTVSASLSHGGNVSGATDVGGVIGEISGGTQTGQLSLTSGTISGTTNVGGIVGLISGGNVSSGYNATGSISGTTNVGGTIGQASGGTLSGTFSMTTNSGSTIDGVSNVGGAIGNLGAGVTYTANGNTHFNAGAVTSTGANNTTGGIFGVLSGTHSIGSSLTNAGAVTNNTAGVTGIGGIVGQVLGTISFISPLILNTGDIQATNGTNVGGIFGEVLSGATITGATLQSSFSSSVVGSTNVGGIIGSTAANIISAMTNTGPVTGDMYVGGLVGHADGSRLSGNLTFGFSNTNVTLNAAGSGAGFIAGRMTGASQITAANITIEGTSGFSNIAGTSDIGNIVGIVEDTTVLTTLTTATLSLPTALSLGNVDNVGGVIGSLVGATFTTDLDSIMNVTGNDNVGGIVGFVDATSTINADFDNTHTVSGASNVGGLIGASEATGSIMGAFTASNNVTGTSNVGGHIGRVLNSTLASTYALTGGTISGTTDIGGIVGEADSATLSGTFTHATGTTSGATNIGGIVGNVVDSTLSGDFDHNSGIVSGTGSNIGGIFGTVTGASVFSASVDLDSAAAANVNGNSPQNVGGLIGSFNSATATYSAVNEFSNAADQSIPVAGSRYGGIFGHIDFNGTIANNLTNTSDASVGHTAGSDVGGLIGQVNNATFTGTLTNNGTVQGRNNVGGLFGYLNDADFSNATFVAAGTVISDAGGIGGIGGVIGTYDDASPLPTGGIYSTATIDSHVNSTGGIFGIVKGTTISIDLSVNANVAGDNVGGIVGALDNAILSGNLTYGDPNDLSTTTLTVRSQSGGGIVGRMSNGSQITGNMTLRSLVAFDLSNLSVHAGGIVGDITGTASIQGTKTFMMDTITPINATSGIFGGIIGEMNSADYNGADPGDDLSSGVNVTSTGRVGGVIGQFFSGTIGSNITLTNTHTVTSTGSDAGGVLGQANAGTFNGTFINSGDVTSAADAGGIIGETAAGITLNGTFRSTGGSVSGGGVGNIFTGGLFNALINPVIGASAVFENASNVTTTNLAVGGITGIFAGTVPFTVTNDFTNTGTITGNTAGTPPFGGIGGIFGSTLSLGAVFELSGDLSNSGNIVSSNGQSIGGITGNLSGPITLSGTLTNTGTSIGGANAIDVGGLVGIVQSGATISGTGTSSGTVNGVTDIGGLIGEVNASTVSAGLELTSGTISGTTNVGGLVGNLTGATLSGGISSSGGTVQGSTNVGGLIGSLAAGNTFTPTGDITNAANVTGTGASGIGGVVGNWALDGAWANDITNTGDVTGTSASSLGGITGTFDGAKTLSGTLINSGDIDGAANVGGIIGLYNATGTVTNTSNAGTITGTNSVGGIFGSMTDGTVQLAYNNSTNSVTAVNDVGGIVGNLGGGGAIENALFGGKVTGSGNDIGGIVGENSGMITNVLGIGEVNGGTNVGALIGNNLGTLMGGLVDPDINGTGVGAGDTNGFTAPAHSTFATQSTYEDVGFSFGANGWNLTEGFYAAPNWCAGACRIVLNVTPPTPPTPPTPTPTPTPDNSITRQQLLGLQNTEYLLENEPEFIPEDLRYYRSVSFFKLNQLAEILPVKFKEIVSPKFMAQMVLVDYDIVAVIETENILPARLLRHGSLDQLVDVVLQYYATEAIRRMNAEDE